MSFVLDAFDVFLDNISLPESQMAAAQRSNGALRDFLGRDAYFGGLTLDSFLNGSYARRTVIRPIKDVDIIVVVDADWMQGDPSRAMEALRRKLAQRYPDWRTRRQRRAVKVTLSDIDLDVVLAVAPSGLDHSLRIPDRELRSWIETDPKRQLKLTGILGARTGGNYPRLVRLFKSWARARVAAPDRPSSFVLECAVYHVLAAQPADFSGQIDAAFETMMQRLLAWDFGRGRNLLPWAAPIVSDPALPESNVAKRWPSAGADRVRSRIEHALRSLDRVHRSRYDDTEVRHWGTVFGSPFPAPSTVERRA